MGVQPSRQAQNDVRRWKAVGRRRTERPLVADHVQQPVDRCARVDRAEARVRILIEGAKADVLTTAELPKLYCRRLRMRCADRKHNNGYA